MNVYNFEMVYKWFVGSSDGVAGLHCWDGVAFKIPRDATTIVKLLYR
jgi:hypothetical protein